MSRDLPDVTIVIRLEVERRMRGWTQKQLSKMIGMNYAQVGRIERGEVTLPTLRCRTRLEEIFGMPYAKLLEVIV